MRHAHHLFEKSEKRCAGRTLQRAFPPLLAGEGWGGGATLHFKADFSLKTDCVSPTLTLPRKRGREYFCTMYLRNRKNGGRNIFRLPENPASRSGTCRDAVQTIHRQARQQDEKCRHSHICGNDGVVVLGQIDDALWGIIAASAWRWRLCPVCSCPQSRHWFCPDARTTRRRPLG